MSRISNNITETIGNIQYVPRAATRGLAVDYFSGSRHFTAACVNSIFKIALGGGDPTGGGACEGFPRVRRIDSI